MIVVDLETKKKKKIECKKIFPRAMAQFQLEHRTYMTGGYNVKEFLDELWSIDSSGIVTRHSNTL